MAIDNRSILIKLSSLSLITIALIGTAAMAEPGQPSKPPRGNTDRDLKRGRKDERGQTRWSPLSNKHLNYLLVYDASESARAPGVYQRTFSHEGPRGQSIYDERFLISEDLQPMPLDPSISQTELSSHNPYLLARPNYALVSNKSKDLYVISDRGLNHISTLPVENILAQFNIAHSNDRHANVFDLVVICNAESTSCEMLIFRDDGEWLSAGYASFDSRTKIISLNGQDMVKTQDYVTVLEKLIPTFPKIQTRELSESNKRSSAETTHYSMSDYEAKINGAVPRNRSLVVSPQPGFHKKYDHEGNPIKQEANPAADFLPDLTDVEVIGQDGKKTTAKTIIKAFVHDVSADVRKHDAQDFTADDELEKNIARGLLRKQRGNVAVLGESGSGKTTAVESLVYNIKVAKKPELQALSDYTFLTLSAAALNAGNSLVGGTEAKINAVVEFSRANKVIWVLDEMHVLRGLGTSSHDSNDVLDLMMTPLADGTLRAIGMTTKQSFWSMFGGDDALLRRFSIAEVERRSDEQVLKIARSWLARFKLPKTDEDILVEAVRLSSEMDPTRAQPDATISLLDEAYAEKAMGLNSSAKTTPIDLADLHQADVRQYRLNPTFMDPAGARARLEKLKLLLDEKIIGQDVAKKLVIQLTAQVLADVHDNSKPRIMAMLTGKKGLGKTEFVKTYAEALGFPIEIIEMNKFSNPHAGFDRMGLMEAVANAINKSPFVVIGFDEFEKAPIGIQNELLKMLNDGEFEVTVRNKGENGSLVSRKINARKASIFFTANAGQDFLRENNRPPIGFTSTQNSESASSKKQSLYVALEGDNLSNVIIDRANIVIPFIETTRDEFKRVMKLHLLLAADGVAKRKNLTIAIQNEAEFLEAAAQRLYHPEISNREALRAIQDEVRQVLAEALLGQVGVKNVVLKFDGQQFVTELSGPGCAILLKGDN